MPRVILTAVLRELASSEPVEVQGDSVAAVLASLVGRYPRLKGWILDERAQIRSHVNVFVNDDRAELGTPVASADQIWVIPAISGGSRAPDETSIDEIEVLVGTKKGLFVLRGERGRELGIAHRLFAGQEVPYAMRDPRTGRYLASVVHGQFGPHLFHGSGFDEDWHEAEGLVLPDDSGQALERIWSVVPGEESGQVWAGVAPAALFESRDGGLSWTLNEGLWNVPSRSNWEGGLGGLVLHSICPWPDDPDRVTVGISAAGVWHTEDGGQSWRRVGKGLVSRYLPDGAQADADDQCVHHLHRSMTEPRTLYMQFHGGVYRSDDAGENWGDIGTDSGLPADFGFPLVGDPRDPDRAWVIPLNSDADRVSAGCEVRVYETRDRGRTWHGFGDGLPAQPAYLTILRQAFCHDGQEPLGLYFGATSGDLFSSVDSGRRWREATRHLPPILSVRCA